MWRSTFPFLLRTAASRWGAVVAVVVGGLVAGSIATTKSLIESRIIQLVANGIDSRKPGDVWTAPLGAVGGDSDWTSEFANAMFRGLDFLGGIAVYIVITVIAAGMSVLTTSAREALSREMFTRLHAACVDAAFSRGTPADTQTDEPGGLAGAIQQGSQSVASAYAFLVETAQYFFGLVTVILLLTKVSLGFAAACFGLTLAFAAVSWIQGAHLSKRRKLYDAKRRNLFAFTDDVLANRDVLLAHERKDLYGRRLQQATYELAGINRALSIRERSYAGTVSILQDIGRIGILAIALIAAVRGSQVNQVGDAYFYISIFARLMAPILGLLSGYDDVRRSTSSSDTVINLLNAEIGHSAPDQESADGESNETGDHAAGFHDVTFQYDDKLVLEGCHFTVPTGGVTLILGRSGAGKTTIARLLLGFLHPREGTVEVFGRSVRDWNHEAMLATMSYLAQTGHVVDGSVRENLFADDSVDEHTLITALRNAGMADTDGQAADLLELTANTLSEGQKQRLALARILVDRSPLVVLDEPLAGVDAFTFREVREHLTTWLSDSRRTVVLISHRLAFAAHASHVVVLGDHGKVLEQGSPTDLAKDNGVFASLLQTARSELDITASAALQR